MLDLRTLNFDKESDTAEFSQSLDLSEVHWWGYHPIKTPVTVKGTITKNHRDLLLNYTVEYTSVLPCARCLTQVERSFSPSLFHVLKETGEEPQYDEDFVPVSNWQIDLTRLVLSDIVPEMDNAPLCKEDCLGLCPICGVDRNQTSCDCQPQKLEDPRFDVLRQLLDKESKD